MDIFSINLKFTGYEITKLKLIKTSSQNIQESHNIGIAYKIIPNRNENFSKVNVIQGIRMEASDEFPYELEIVIKGNFELKNCSNDDDKLNFVIVNASAILFPYLRSTVTLLTSQLDYEKIILPVMNFHNVIDGIPKDELVLDCSLFEEF